MCLAGRQTPRARRTRSPESPLPDPIHPINVEEPTKPSRANPRPGRFILFGGTLTPASGAPFTAPAYFLAFFSFTLEASW